MKFYDPVKVYEDTDCVSKHAGELASLGKHALIVTGKHSSRLNGSLTDVMRALSSHGVICDIYDEVKQNPDVESVMAARDLGLSKGADFVIGIGGGSPMDAAKAVALMIKHKDCDPEFLYDTSKADITDALPLAAVPTTCGTGSEVTAVSVLEIKERRSKQSIKHKFFFDLALLDPKYLMSMPKSVLRTTAVDALCHLTESRINSTATSFSIMTNRMGFELWRSARDIISGDEDMSPEGAQALLEASTMGGMSIVQTDTSVPHGLSYRVTIMGGVPHGRACGYFLPNYIEHADREVRREVLSAMGFSDTDYLREFYVKLFGETSVSEEVLEAAVDDVMKNSTGKLALCPFKCDYETLREIAGLK
ncbi:MAG: iron-containing alcohol dehydrogenase family protein [Eubacteriales bacterium]|nr:iron-containing alcohol dehydrogenase family protein [Eubacteriales bacterium]